MTSLRIAALSIGDELLDGRIKDGNTHDLGNALSALGLELGEARVIPDVRQTIVDTVRALVQNYDIIVTSGGLGPTSDDVTAECLAEAAGCGLRFDVPSFVRLQAMFEGRGIEMPANNRRQAMLPASSRTLVNQMGTAPGFVTPFVVGDRSVEVWSFPGVPREYHHLRDDELLPVLLQRLSSSGAALTLVRRTLRCLGLAESAIGERLSSLSAANGDVRVQYRVAFPEIIVRLVFTVDATDAGAVAAVNARADALADEARAAIGSGVWGMGDEPLEERVLTAARARGLTVATAESCTGGLVAKRLTDVAGSSDVVQGGVVSYANSAKVGLLDVPQALLDAHGAVSAPVAEAMAAGARARLGASLAVSVTGVAGPGGGSADKPVGTVFFGLATPDGVTSVRKKFPDFGRERIRDMTAATALRLLLSALTGPDGTDGES
jgi:nicotinamide-nucleotide amidase